MAKRDEAALKLLRWELAGHGGLVLEAMLRHLPAEQLEGCLIPLGHPFSCVVKVQGLQKHSFGTRAGPSEAPEEYLLR